MLQEMLTIVLSASFVFSIIRISTPIIFASLGACISEQVSITNIGIEGMMTMAALAGVLGSAATGSAWLGLLFAILTGVILGLVLSSIIIKLNTDIMLSGIALNLVCNSGAALILYVVSGDRGVSTSIPSLVLPNIEVEALNNIPVLGDILLGHCVLTYIAIALIFVLNYYFKHSVTALRMRSIGEHETAASSAGIDVNKYKRIALALSGLMAGMAGAFLSMSYISFFTTGITAGRGYIAIAAAVMGGRKPLNCALVALLFGAANALSNAMPTGLFPQDFVQMFPYLVTVIGLTIRAASESRRHQHMLHQA